MSLSPGEMLSTNPPVSRLYLPPTDGGGGVGGGGLLVLGFGIDCETGPESSGGECSARRVVMPHILLV